jgi:hypothetical protein
MLRLACLALGFAMTAAALAAPAKEEPGARRVCRAPTANLGSRIKRAKICHTADEWEEIDRARRGPELRTKPSQLEPWERTRPQ